MLSDVCVLGYIGRVDSIVDVSVCDTTVLVELPKRAFTCARSIRLTKFGSPTSEKVVSLGFGTSGGLRVSNG